MTFFAILAVCSIPAQQCAWAEDTTGPHATKEACEARLVEMAPAARVIARRAGPGPHRVWAVCDDLERIRRVIPGAFEGEQMGWAI